VLSALHLGVPSISVPPDLSDNRVMAAAYARGLEYAARTGTAASALESAAAVVGCCVEGAPL
jgi:hypothetical protein